MVATIIWGALVAIVLLQVGYTEGRKKFMRVEYMPCPRSKDDFFLNH